MATYRKKNSFNRHYSDQHGDMGAQIGSIIAVYVDEYSTVNGTIDKDAVAYNYPGYVYCEGQDLNISDFPLLYEAIGNKYGGPNPSTVDLKTWNGAKTANSGNTGHTPGGIDLGTFKVPDLRMKRINGPGGIDGAGSLTPDEAAMEVGDTGGEWYISRARQLKEYTFGSVRISGYTNVVGFIPGSLSGTADIEIGPLEEKFLQGPPPHSHVVLGSEHDTRSVMDAQDTAGSDQQPGWDTGYGMILESQLPQGDAAGHTHWIAEFRPARNSTDAALDDPKDMYSYDVSETYAHEYAAPGTDDAQGQVVYTVQNNQDTSYTWVCPTGVTSVCALCIGGGAGGMSGNLGGGGGGLGYKNNISVIPGQSYTVHVGHGGTGSTATPNTDYANVRGGDSYFITYGTVLGKGGGNYGTPPTTAMGGGFIGDGGGRGGHATTYGGGGGAGGYSGYGGGGQTGSDAQSGSGGGGAGCDCSIAGANNGACGGGTGLLGIGANGQGASGGTTSLNTTYTLMSGGGAGSGGQAGENTNSPLLKTANWVPISNAQLSSGAANVWSTFMLNKAIYPIAPSLTINDPYLGTTQTVGWTYWVPTGTTISSVTCTLECDGQATLRWIRPNDPSNQPVLDLSASSVSSGTPPYTGSATGQATNLGEGYHVLLCTITNGAVTGAGADNTWGNNPGGIAFTAVRDDTNATIIDSRTNCTGGLYGYGDAKGGDGGYPGGGGGANYWHSENAVATDPGDGAHGAVRLMCGPNRTYPSAAADVATQTTDEAINAYDNPWGSFKHNDGKDNENDQTVTFIKSKQMNVTPAQAGIQLNEGTLTMTGAEQLEVAAGIVPRQPVPLVLKYFRVKYLIKAF